MTVRILAQAAARRRSRRPAGLAALALPSAVPARVPAARSRLKLIAAQASQAALRGTSRTDSASLALGRHLRRRRPIIRRAGDAADDGRDVDQENRVRSSSPPGRLPVRSAGTSAVLAPSPPGSHPPADQGLLAHPGVAVSAIPSGSGCLSYPYSRTVSVSR